MQEIKIYFDSEKTQLLTDISRINFGVINAGVKTVKKLYFENIIDYDIELEYSLKGDNIILTTNKSILKKGETTEVSFELNPSPKLMKPIKADLNLKLKYLVE